MSCGEFSVRLSASGVFWSSEERELGIVELLRNYMDRQRQIAPERFSFPFNFCPIEVEKMELLQEKVPGIFKKLL